MVFAIAALGMIYFGVDTLKRRTADPERAFAPPKVRADPIPRPAPKPPVPATATATAPTPTRSESPLDTADASPALVHSAPGTVTDSLENRPTTALRESPPETAHADTGAAVEQSATEPGAGLQELRYTTIWANVRESRRPVAPVVMILEPGEPVLVDSLREEWYRVVADGQKLGYVYRGLVDTAPPVMRN